MVTGLCKGLHNIGGHIQSARHMAVIEAFCAYTGLIAAPNGRLKQWEVAGFRHFLVREDQRTISFTV